MKEISELLARVAELEKDGDSYWHWGVEYSSDQNKPTFKAYVGWSKEGVTPVQFASQSRAKLIKEINQHLINHDGKNVNVRYHEAMADALENAVNFHRDTAKALAKE